MNLWSAISLGFKEIWAHKFRSMLTMLGIILGVSSLIAMSAMVQGMEKGMKEALIAVGGLTKFRVEPQDLPAEQRHLRDQAPGITMADVTALKASAPELSRISPEMRLMGASVTANNKSLRPFICAGVWPVALEMYEHTVEHGRVFNDFDEETARSVCVIGTSVRDELFGAPEETGKEVIPIGETIYINRMPFTIIGMFKHYESDQEKRRKEIEKLEPKKVQTGPSRSRGWGGRGRGGGFVYYMKNTSVLMPMNTMWVKLRSSGVRPGLSRDPVANPALPSLPDPRLSVLEIKVADLDRLTAGIQQARNVMMSTHKGIEDFTFRTQEDWAENITVFIRNARLSGGFIAGISLIVGGIGIMNIMLASISERVREIGIRKSIGATDIDVFVQIIIESVVIAIVGGVAGLASSYGLVKLITTLSPTDNAPIISISSMLGAFAFSVVIGIVAGLIPAWKASRLNPIQALRYE